MINFFRKVRKNLLNSNRAGKYLLYAIGEIFLVVIGILLALQINNWNENRKERKLETSILNEILVNLEKDVANLNSKTELNEFFINNNKVILNHLKNKTPITDSLRQYYASLYGRGNFQPITVAYDNLKSNGINIIKNDSLRLAISELYDFKYFYFTEDIQADYIPIQNAHINQLTTNIKTKIPYVSAEPVNLIELQGNVQFAEDLIQFSYYLSWINTNYSRGIKQIEEVKEKIKKALNQ